jgi:hypothetical protein
LDIQEEEDTDLDPLQGLKVVQTLGELYTHMVAVVGKELMV